MSWPQFEMEKDARAPALPTVRLRHLDVAAARNDGVLHTPALLAKCALTPLTILDVVVVVAQAPILRLAPS
jgi:hypothetical protein